MKYFKQSLVAGALLSVSLSAAAIPMYTANLSPINGSGVSGVANLAYNQSAKTLKVTVNATGLESNQVHPMHIHGVIGGNSVSPTIANDSPSNGGNGNGFIELGEAASSYGPVLIPLTSPPGGALSDFPTAPNGTISFSQTYDLSSAATFGAGYSLADVFPLTNREIVIHGLTVPNGVQGNSTGAPAYEALLPVSTGVIQAADVPEPGDLAMLVLGVGLIGGLVLARKRQQGGANLG